MRLNIIFIFTSIFISQLITAAERRERANGRALLKHKVNMECFNCKTWIEGPNGYRYQFHVGDQSWLHAQELCLSINSNLITIDSEEKLDWLISRYPSLPSNRKIQIGLKYDDGEEGWKWVNNKPFDEKIFMNTKSLTDRKNFRCAVLLIDSLKLQSVDCYSFANLEKINRFVCERNETHFIKHERSNNPFWSLFERLTKLLERIQKSPANTEKENEELSMPTLDDNVHRAKDEEIEVKNTEITSNKTQIDVATKIIDEIDELAKSINKERNLAEESVKNSNETDTIEETLKTISNEGQNFTIVKNSKKIASVFSESESTEERKYKKIAKDIFDKKRIAFAAPLAIVSSTDTKEKKCDEISESEQSKAKKIGEVFIGLKRFINKAGRDGLRELLDSKHSDKTFLQRLKEATSDAEESLQKTESEKIEEINTGFVQDEKHVNKNKNDEEFDVDLAKELENLIAKELLLYEDSLKMDEKNARSTSEHRAIQPNSSTTRQTKQTTENFESATKEPQGSTPFVTELESSIKLKNKLGKDFVIPDGISWSKKDEKTRKAINEDEEVKNVIANIEKLIVQVKDKVLKTNESIRHL